MYIHNSASLFPRLSLSLSPSLPRSLSLALSLSLYSHKARTHTHTARIGPFLRSEVLAKDDELPKLVQDVPSYGNHPFVQSSKEQVTLQPRITTALPHSRIYGTMTVEGGGASSTILILAA